MLDVIDARVPVMQLDSAHLDKAEKARKIIEPKPRAFAALALLVSLCTESGTGGSRPL